MNVTEQQSKLLFSIEESVWLNRGEEIDTVLGMSLEPDIVIKDEGEEVVIKGGLQLSGEYKPLEENDSLGQRLFPRNMTDDRTTDRKKLTHFLPIDVTIPRNRIDNLNEVYVQVESFDYDLPEKSCIQLSAEISIGGMVQQNEEKQVQVPKETPAVATDAQTSFLYEAKRKPALNMKSANIWNEKNKDDRTPGALLFNQETEEDIDQVALEHKEKEEVPVRQEENRKEKMEIEEKQAEIEADIEEKEEGEEEVTSESTEPEESVTFDRQMETEDELIEEEIEMEEEKAAQPEEKRQSHQEENALYLTKVMADEEERFTKLRMCIIQENESLETIASRYDVSTSQLIRMNRLHEEQVEEGQILYIPISSES